MASSVAISAPNAVLGIPRTVWGINSGVTEATDSTCSCTGWTFARGDGVTTEFELPSLVSSLTTLYRRDWQGNVALSASARTNLFLNSVWSGGGNPPASWARVVGNGTASASTLGSGYAAYTFTASASQQIYSQNVSLSALTNYCFSVIIEAVTGNIPANDALYLLSPLSGSTVTYPVCPANPIGGSGGLLVPGELICNISVGATGGSQAARFGCGCFNNATGSTRLSHPQCEVGSTRSSFIPTTAAPVTVTDYTASGTTLTLAEAPVIGADLSVDADLLPHSSLSFGGK